MSNEFGVAGRMNEYIHSQDLVVPPTYRSRRSELYFVEHAVTALVPLLVLLATLAFHIAHAALTLLCLGSAIFILYRAYWMWVNRVIVCDPSVGLITVMQEGHWWLLLNTSSPDNFGLDELDLNTPNRTIMQRMFDCDTIKFKDGRSIEHVVNVAHLRDIQDYRKKLSKEYVRLQKNTNELLLHVIAGQERTNDLLTRMCGLLGPYQLPSVSPDQEFES